MTNCAIYGCHNHSNKYFRFPQREDINANWVAVCERKCKINIKNARICSIHFGPESFTKSRAQMMLNYSPEKCRKLKDDSVTMLHLSLKENKNQDNQRSERYKRRGRKNLVREILANASTNPWTAPCGCPACY